MRVVVSGGSNSLRKGGYVAHLSALAGDSVEVVNISLGAAPSLMGYFQQCRIGELKAGDILVLEYALNDLNHIAAKGYGAGDLLRTVELILRHYAARDVRVQPVLMRPLPFEAEIVTPRFHEELHRLFEHYCLPYIDVSGLAREALGVPHLSKMHYEDVNHYKPNGEVVRLVAQRLLSCLSECRTPLLATPIHCGEDQNLEVQLELDGGTRSMFASGAAQVHYYRPDNGSLTAAIGKDAILAGMVVLAGPDGGVLAVKCEDRHFKISLCHDHRDFDKLAIKMVGLDNLLDTPLLVKGGETIEVSWPEDGTGALVDMGFRKPRKGGPSGRQGGVIGLVYETGARPQRAEIEEAAIQPSRRSGRNRSLTNAGSLGSGLRQVKGVDRPLPASVERLQVESRKVSTMTSSETSTDKAPKAPMDAEGFLTLLEAVQKFTGTVERTLRRAAPRITLADFLALRAVAAREADPSADAVRPAIIKGLTKQGYVVEAQQGGGHALSDKGRKALEALSAAVAEVSGALGEGDRPLNAAAGRPLVRATLKLRRLNADRSPEAAPAAEEAQPV